MASEDAEFYIDSTKSAEHWPGRLNVALSSKAALLGFALAGMVDLFGQTLLVRVHLVFPCVVWRCCWGGMVLAPGHELPTRSDAATRGQHPRAPPWKTELLLFRAITGLEYSFLASKQGVKLR